MKLLWKQPGSFPFFTIMLALVWVGVTACFIACQATPATTITPGTASNSDNYSKRGTADEDSTTTDITITAPASTPNMPQPAAQPGADTTPPSTQPVSVDFGTGKKIEAPAGSSVHVSVTEHKTGTPALTTRNRLAQATGAGFTSNKEGAGQTDGKPSKAELQPISPDGEGGGGGDSSDGSFAYSWTGIAAALSPTSKMAAAFDAISVLLFLGSIAFVLGPILLKTTPKWVMAGATFLASLLSLCAGIMIDTHPMALIAIAAGVLTLIGIVIYHEVKTSTPVTTPASGTATPAPTGFISTVESDAKAVVAKAEGVIAGFMAKAPATPTTVAPIVPAPITGATTK